jgi:hypothetical protein
MWWESKKMFNINPDPMITLEIQCLQGAVVWAMLHLILVLIFTMPPRWK